MSPPCFSWDDLCRRRAVGIVHRRGAHLPCCKTSRRLVGFREDCIQNSSQVGTQPTLVWAYHLCTQIPSWDEKCR